jgi:hypothetical protein
VLCPWSDIIPLIRSVTAIFNSNLSNKLGSGIAAAVLPLGFPPNELEQFIGALAPQNEAALAQVPDVTPQIIGAGVHALQAAFLGSSKPVQIAATVISGVTVIGESYKDGGQIRIASILIRI